MLFLYVLPRFQKLILFFPRVAFVATMELHYFAVRWNVGNGYGNAFIVMTSICGFIRGRELDRSWCGGVVHFNGFHPTVFNEFEICHRSLQSDNLCYV